MKNLEELEKEFKEVIKFLKGYREDTSQAYAQQKVYADKNKKGFLWAPGKKAKKAIVINQAVAYIGVTPGCFLSRLKSADGIHGRLTFLGADFDYKDNNPEDLDNLKEMLLETNELTLRTSASGKGFHAFLRLKNTIWTGKTSAERNQLCKEIWQDYLITKSTELRELFYKCLDKNDYRAYYIVGGKNEWLYKSDFRFDAKREKTMNRTVEAIVKKRPKPKYGKFHPKIAELVTHLVRSGISVFLGKNQIYVKEIYEALKGTKWEFKTSSKMKSTQWHTNGFMIVSYDELTLIPSADNYPVLYLRTASKYENFIKNNTR